MSGTLPNGIVTSTRASGVCVPYTMGQQVVHVEPPATRPRFHNVEPRSREERLAIRDKDMLEKLRLEHRLKSNVQQDLNSNLLEPPPNAAGFISEADRFCTDAAGEEYASRQRKKLEREELVERKRVINYERETKRWDRVRMEEKFEDIKLQELKESQIPDLNKSSVKYNMITLEYEPSHDGQTLKYKDDLMKRNMAVAANRGLRHMKSSVNYDMITGLPTNTRMPVPEMPTDPGPALEKVDPRANMEYFRLDSLYDNEKESHEGVGRQKAY